MFITFEGIDRSGKTTQARMLAEALGNDALLVREPGGTPAAERIRELVKSETALTPIAETLLFGAARAEREAARAAKEAAEAEAAGEEKDDGAAEKKKAPAAKSGAGTRRRKAPAGT